MQRLHVLTLPIAHVLVLGQVKLRQHAIDTQQALSSQGDHIRVDGKQTFAGKAVQRLGKAFADVDAEFPQEVACIGTAELQLQDELSYCLFLFVEYVAAAVRQVVRYEKLVVFSFKSAIFLSLAKVAISLAAVGRFNGSVV